MDKDLQWTRTKGLSLQRANFIHFKPNWENRIMNKMYVNKITAHKRTKEHRRPQKCFPKHLNQGRVEFSAEIIFTPSVERNGPVAKSILLPRSKPKTCKQWTTAMPANSGERKQPVKLRSATVNWGWSAVTFWIVLHCVPWPLRSLSRLCSGGISSLEWQTG